MMTKKVYAQYLIDSFKKDQNIPLNTPNKDLNEYVMQCTSLGIGLEYLGELDEKYKDYISNRSGLSVISPFRLEMDLYPDNMKELAKKEAAFEKYYFNHNLSVRELMELLPDDVK